MTEKQAHYTAANVAAVLEVQASTLRKYAGLLEAEGYAFDKDGHGRRIYSAMDVTVFEKLIALSHSGAMSLKDSARAAYHWSKTPDVAPSATDGVALYRRHEGEMDTGRANTDAEQLAVALEEQKKLISVLVETVGRQNEEMAALQSAMEQMARQQAENAEATRSALERLSAAQEKAATLPAPEPEEDRRRSFFGRLFGRGH